MLVAGLAAAAICALSPSARAARPTARNAVASTSAQWAALANTIRSRGCDGRRGVGPPLRRQPRLDLAAAYLASGAGLGRATAAAGYRAARSVSLRISGDLAAAAVARVLAAHMCASLTDPGLRDVGFFGRGGELWVLAAAPFAAPELSNPARVAERVLDLVNAARAGGRRCGSRFFAPAAPLRLSPQLYGAAIAHSRDMAARSYLDHVGTDGSTPAVRVSRTGYRWRAVGENIAAGLPSAREAVDGWLASPPHCANIMDPDFTATAIAYAVDAKSRMGVYWTEVFAAPLRERRQRARAR